MRTSHPPGSCRLASAPYHPSRLPTRPPRSGEELEALLARGRMLRARTVLAIWLRARRRWQRRLRGLIHPPVPPRPRPLAFTRHGA